MGSILRTIKVKDVKHGMRGILVEGRVIAKKPVDMRSRINAHALATVMDDTGEIALNLWRNQIEQVRVGDAIILRNAFARKYKGRLELSLWGDIEKRG